MSPGAQVDYDALAKQYGAAPAPAAGAPPPVDYDALAQQHGAIGAGNDAMESRIHQLYDQRPLWRKVLGLDIDRSQLKPDEAAYLDQVQQRAQKQIGDQLSGVYSGYKEGAVAGAKMAPFVAVPGLGSAVGEAAGGGLIGGAANALTQGAAAAGITKAEGGSNKEAAVAGAGFAALPAAGAVAGKVADVIAPQSRLINPAKEAFNSVRQAAQDSSLQVKTTNAMRSALDLREYANLTKEYVPAPVRGFLDRLVPGKSPLPGYEMQKPPLSYDEARKLYSATATLSRDELGKLSPTMAAKVQAFKTALGDSIESAAGSIGKQQQYNFAMQKFAQGMRYIGQREKALELFKDNVMKWALGGAVGGAGYSAYKELTK